ncbi:MAG: lactonase family protein [Candidatus Symbiothrix sp.]|jgi:6-phosphogluconolactonase (cycloisomerase 2 family)|nr:lactonase family protein [Candidatus Symbiothrix sp.]
MKLLAAIFLIAGSYSDGTTSGISVYRFDTKTGDFEYVSDTKGILNPSYIAVSPDEKTVYSVNETRGGAVCSFRFDKTTGALDFLNTQPATGADPCYISLNREQTFLVTANYSGGSLSVFPLNRDGSIRALTQYWDMNEPETESPASHIHTAVFSPDEKRLLVTDLGKDKIYSFKTGFRANGTFLVRDTEASGVLEAGSGPRHLAFHPNGKYLYSINEPAGTVTVFRYRKGNLSPVQTVASDTTAGTGGKGSADIHISPDGKFLYSSNRLKADGIAIFSIHPRNGRLTPAGYQPTGIHPRNFILTPDGGFLLCANRNSNQIQIFERDRETGLLRDTGKTIAVNQPACLKWISK